MSVITILNIVIINVMVWVGLSYFWSFWTHKVFKPWMWLELHKRKLINSSVESTERKVKDRVKYLSVFFAMQQVERMEVQGEFVMLGVEEEELLSLLRLQCPGRTVRAIGPMEPTTYSIVRENCQGEISEEVVPIDFVAEERVRNILPEGPRNIVVKGAVGEHLDELQSPIALAIVMLVDHDDVLSALRAAYSRLTRGGILIVGSYNHDWAGVTKAVDEFAASIPEGFVPLPDMYGSVEMVKS